MFGWPSFPSYVIDARKLGAVPQTVPLRDDRYDLEAILDADRPAHEARLHLPPEQPDRHDRTRGPSSTRTSSASPTTCSTVLDQAYFEYIDDPDYRTGSSTARGGAVLVLRTFSKIYGLAGLRIGFGIGPAPVVTAIGKVRRAFDLNLQAQAAALASLDDDGEIDARRLANAEGALRSSWTLGSRLRAGEPGRGELRLRRRGRGRAAALRGAAAGGRDRPARRGFGAPNGIRVTVGTPEENAFFAEALGGVRAASGYELACRRV